VKFWLPTDSEPCSEASNFEDYFEEDKEEKEKEQQQQQQQPQQKSKHRLQQVAAYQPGDRLKKGTQIFILLSDQQKGVKKSEGPQF
jgi:glycine cleavage system protein P-like pyridoxal-binding family